MQNSIKASAVAAILLAAGSAQALPQKLADRGQEPGPGQSPFQAGAKPILKKPEGSAAIVHTMADELGMVRLNLFKTLPGEDLDIVNRLQIGGSGMMTDPKTKAVSQISRYVYGISLHTGAARLDVQRKDASGKASRMVEVVSGDQAWDEAAPGVGGKFAPDQVRPRLFFYALFPQAFVRAAIKADLKTVQVAEAGDVTTVTVPIDGAPVTATLDQDYRPAKIVVSFKDPKQGRTTLEADYGRYWDITEYGVMFPRSVTIKRNGFAVFDLKIDDGRVGPYLIFPAPTAIASR